MNCKACKEIANRNSHRPISAPLQYLFENQPLFSATSIQNDDDQQHHQKFHNINDTKGNTFQMLIETKQ